jgi:hypothetical protein
MKSVATKVNSLRANNCLKAITYHFVTDIGIGHRMWTSHTSILVVFFEADIILL